MLLFPSFTWRGAALTGQVLEVRAVLGSGSASAVSERVSILINKEA